MSQKGLFLLSLCIYSSLLSAADLHIAVASNFIKTVQPLIQQFEQQHKIKITRSSGSSGKLYAQIINGAPYHIFLAADQLRPQRLEQQGYIIAGSRFNYAIGQLALISFSSREDPRSQLESANFTHMAIANPKLAPYGVAAQQVLQQLGLWGKYQPKIVRGENINQTLQFVQSGNATLGWVALAQIKTLPQPQNYWLPPKGWYTAITQQAGLLKRGKHNPYAKKFLAFLQSPSSQKYITQSGYLINFEPTLHKK